MPYLNNLTEQTGMISMIIYKVTKEVVAIIDKEE